MLSLLALSLALGLPATATPLSDAALPQSGVDSNLLAQMQPESPMIVVQEPASSLDEMAIHPDSDVCYKIRAFIFTKGRDPKFLRETTCGPKAPIVKKMENGAPEFTPLQLKAAPEHAPQK